MPEDNGFERPTLKDLMTGASKLRKKIKKGVKKGIGVLKQKMTRPTTTSTTSTTTTPTTTTTRPSPTTTLDPNQEFMRAMMRGKKF